MKHTEQKYHVESFARVESKLRELNAKPDKTSTSRHYYGQHQGSGVVKLVVHDNHSAIHILDERGGKFSLRENIPVENKTSGLRWLKQNGYDEIGLIKMEHTDYDYKGGIVGLYTLNDSILSVILDFPGGMHEQVEQELGLDSSQLISDPYDKHLEQLGRFKTVKTVAA